MGVLRMCYELNEEIGSLIPPGSYVIITLHAPVDKLRKFKHILKAKIIEYNKRRCVRKSFFGYPWDQTFKMRVVKGFRASGKKVVGIVANKILSIFVISLNVDFILRNRIQEKTQKCSKVTHRPLWLALFNDYWLAEPNSYRYAMEQYSESHPFGKILLILGNREVHTIYEP